MSQHLIVHCRLMTVSPMLVTESVAIFFSQRQLAGLLVDMQLRRRPVTPHRSQSRQLASLPIDHVAAEPEHDPDRPGHPSDGLREDYHQQDAADPDQSKNADNWNLVRTAVSPNRDIT